MYKTILSILKKKTQGKISDAISKISNDIYLTSKYHHFIHYQASAAYFFRGHANVCQNKMDSARTDFAKAIFQDHSNQDAINALALLDARSKLSQNIPKSYISKLITEFGYINLNQKNISDSYYTKAIVHYNAQQFEQAIDNMLTSLHNSCNKYALHDLAMSYIMNAQYDEALKYATLALREDQKYGHAYFSLGLGHLFQKDFVQAEKCLNLAVELLEIKHNEYHANFSLKFYNRALMHYKLGELDLCINDLNKALELDSNNFDALDLHSKIYVVIKG